MVAGSIYRSADILHLCNFGYSVENNNIPAPENIPPSLVGYSPPHCRGSYFRNGTATNSTGRFFKGVDTKTPSL